MESLKIQQEHMLVVRDRHRFWVQDTGDIEINRIRRDIIDLIEKTVDQYDLLLEALQRRRAGDAVEASNSKSGTASD